MSMYSGNTARAVQAPEIGYDLSRFDRRYRVRQAVAAEEAKHPNMRPIAELKTKAEPAAKQMRLPLFAVLGYMMVFLMMLLVVYSYVQINEVAISTSIAQKTLSELKSKNAELKLEYDRMIGEMDLEALAETYGLYAPSEDQIVYIDLSAPDRGEVITPEAETTDLKYIFGGIERYILDFAG